MIFPGLGLVVAGPLAAGLAGAGAGAATAGFIGAFNRCWSARRGSPILQR